MRHWMKRRSKKEALNEALVEEEALSEALVEE